MNKIVFRRKSPIMKTILGIGIFSLGVLVLIGGSYFGLIVCGISIFFIYKDGSEIDLEIQKYRTFIEVLGLRFGKWEDLPEIEYISVFSTTESVIVRAMTAEATIKNDVIVLNLFYNGNHRIKAYSTTNKEDAFKVAKQIAEILKIDILDATEAESKWI